MEPKKSWELIATDEARAWMEARTPAEADRFAKALNLLEQVGPTLGRERVDVIKGSRHRNMKELRPAGGFLRVLFAFDSKQRALMLVGGDKRGTWNRWYPKNIARADNALDRHERNSGKAKTWRITTRTAGDRFEIDFH